MFESRKGLPMMSNTEGDVSDRRIYIHVLQAYLKESSD